MPNLTLPVYENKLEKLEVYPNLKAAKDWLKNNKLNTTGTTILVPFKDENNKIHFLKPSHFNSFLDKAVQDQDKVSNKNIRIIGAENEVHIDFIEQIKAFFEKNRVSHLDELKEDTLSLVDHGFIIIYDEGGHKVGNQFAQLFQEEKQSLLKKIQDAQKNNEPHINPTEFLEEISKLALNLDVKLGMTYFFTTDKQGIQHVYRQTFKLDPTNNNANQYLIKEKEKYGPEEVVIDEHKSQNHHIIQFLKDWCKWTVFSAITAIGAGLILGLFIAPPLGSIAAALVSVITFVGVSGYGFYRADKANSTTTEFGEFEIKSQSYFDRVKQLFSRISRLFSKETVNTLASPVVANDHHVETEEPMIRNVAQNQHLSTNQFFPELEVEKNNIDKVPSAPVFGM